MVERKSEGATILLAVLPSLLGLYGIGHFYVGRIVRGIVILSIGIVLDVIGFYAFFISCEQALLDKPPTIFEIVYTVIGLVFWIWHIFDAKAVCRDHNSKIMQGYYSSPPPQYPPYWQGRR